MATSQTRRNRRRLKAKLINLARDFELQQVSNEKNSHQVNNVVSVDFVEPLEYEIIPINGVFKLFQGKAQRTKLAKNSKWLWFNQYYNNRKAFNKSIGYSSTGMPLKDPNKVIIQKKNDDSDVNIDDNAKLFNLYKAFEYNQRLGHHEATENYYNMIVKLQTKMGFNNPTRLDFISIDLRR